MGFIGAPPPGPWPQTEGKGLPADSDFNRNIVTDIAQVAHLDSVPDFILGADIDTVLSCVWDFWPCQ